MKPRTTLLLAVILVILVGIAALFQYGRRRAVSPEGRPVFPAFDAKKADGIEVETASGTVKLRKQNDKWLVATENSHEADPKLVKQILDAMDQFTSAALISTSKERQSAFEVDSSGVKVRVLQGSKTVANYIVGKAGPDYMSTYIRPVDQDKVYQVPIYLRSVVDRGGETWRRTMVLDLEPDAISSLTAKNAKETLTLEKDATGAWKITEPIQAPAKTDMMSFILNSVARIRSSGFADSTVTPEAAGLSPDTTSVVIHTTDGSTYTVVIGTSTPNNQSYTQLQGEPTIYLVARGRWNTVFRGSAMLRAPEPAKTEGS